MKITCFIFCIIPILLFGQNPKYGCLNISSPSGASFFLYLNNQKINETPQIKVRVEHMYKYVYNVKIEFADSTRLSVQRSKLFICNKSGVFRDFYYDVVKENNLVKLVFKSMPAVVDIVSEKDVFVYDFDEPTTISALVEPQKNDTITDKKKPLVVKNKKGNIKEIEPIIDSIKFIPPVIVNTTPVSELVLVEPENWQCNNGWPMQKAAFEKIRIEIGNETNDVQKLNKSKDLVSKNCITTEQAFELTSLLKTDENKLELSKFCFKYILDIKNYSILGKTFSEEKYKEMFYYFISH